MIASRAIPIDSHKLKGASIPQQSMVSEHRSIEEAFPNVDPGIRPVGSRVIVQLRTPLTVTKGGILLVDETRETEAWNEQTGIVRYLGPLAYHFRDETHADGKFKPWPEGPWCQPGDFVRLMKYNADRIQVPTGPRSEDIAVFVTLKDTEVIAVVTGDPTKIRAFI